MFLDLINKQVACSETYILSFMYPSFKVVTTEFQVETGKPFIYTGNLKYLPLVNKRIEPHIIVSSTGEVNLDDISTMIELAYKKHNKRVPNYIEELIKTWNEQSTRMKITYPPDFLYCWKILWTTGSLPQTTHVSNKLFLDMLINIQNPMLVITKYLEGAQSQESVKYIENQLLKFMQDSLSLDMAQAAVSKDWMTKVKLTFASSYNSQINNSVLYNITARGRVMTTELRVFFLLYDLLNARQRGVS